MWRLEPHVEPHRLEDIREYLEVGELTMAIQSFVGGIHNMGWTDEDVERYAGELEDICRRLQTVVPFVYYGEALRIFRENARPS